MFNKSGVTNALFSEFGQATRKSISLSLANIGARTYITGTPVHKLCPSYSASDEYFEQFSGKLKNI